MVALCTVITARMLHTRQSIAACRWLQDWAPGHLLTHTHTAAVMLLCSGQRTSTVAFHSCMGLWWGCVPPETPALLYHVGGVDMVSHCVLELRGSLALASGWYVAAWAGSLYVGTPRVQKGERVEHANVTCCPCHLLS